MSGLVRESILGGGLPLLELGCGAMSLFNRVKVKSDRSCKYFRTSFMGDVDETAKLWKVNRTIHELVKDRVSCD